MTATNGSQLCSSSGDFSAGVAHFLIMKVDGGGGGRAARVDETFPHQGAESILCRRRRLLLLGVYYRCGLAGGGGGADDALQDDASRMSKHLDGPKNLSLLSQLLPAAKIIKTDSAAGHNAIQGGFICVVVVQQQLDGLLLMDLVRCYQSAQPFSSVNGGGGVGGGFGGDERPSPAE